MHESVSTDLPINTMPLTLPFDIFLNGNAGSVISMGKETIESHLDQSGVSVRSLQILEPDALSEAILAHDPKQSHLLIGGGDGTMRSCAKLLYETSIPFGILPMGTMNLLARDLSVPLQFHEALRAYGEGVQIVNIDMGFLNDEPFLCCACLGTVPETSRFREAFRGINDAIAIPRVALFMLTRMDDQKRRKIRLTVDKLTRKVKASCIVVSNNPFVSEDKSHAFKKDSLQGGKLGIYTITPHSFWDKIRLMMKLGLGGWKEDTSVASHEGNNVHIKTHRKSELVSLDGETMRLHTPLQYDIQTQKLPILIPVRQAEKVMVT